MELIVIVSRTGAKIFEQRKNGSLHVVDTVSNPLGRAKNRELTMERPGVNRGKQAGSSPHGMIGRKNPHDEVVLRFVHKLGRHLKKMLVANDDLVLKIVADAKLTGQLKEEFSQRELSFIDWVKKNVENVPQVEWPNLLKISTVKRYPDGMRYHPSRPS